MNTLLIDAGNSRLKWAQVRDGKLSRQQAVPTGQIREFAAWLARQPAFGQCFASSVAGPAVERELRAALRGAGHAVPQLIHSSAAAAGVSNVYRDPGRLGDDRWAGMIAAWHLAGCYRTICAISVGTALTIDVVDYDGRHRGGLIAPGPALMLQSLLRDTQGIAPRAAVRARPRKSPPEIDLLLKPLADDTGQAIHMGCLYAVAALVDRVVTDVTRILKGRPVVFLTGGGAAAVAPLIRSAHKPREDLVLRGLAVLGGVALRRKG